MVRAIQLWRPPGLVSRNSATCGIPLASPRDRVQEGFGTVKSYALISRTPPQKLSEAQTPWLRSYLSAARRTASHLSRALTNTTVSTTCACEARIGIDHCGHLFALRRLAFRWFLVHASLGTVNTYFELFFPGAARTYTPSRYQPRAATPSYLLRASHRWRPNAAHTPAH